MLFIALMTLRKYARWILMEDKKLILGIDPGCSGAITVLDEEYNYIDHLLMPTFKAGKSSRVNGAALTAFISQYRISHAYLEKVNAMPGQGVVSMFTFGHSAGVVEGIIQGLLIPYTLVTPQSWKKKAGLIGKDKDAARSEAIRLYPSIRTLDKKGAGQALADSILIARFGSNNK